MEIADRKRMVFGDDRSSGADVAWLWINEHRWPGWCLDVVEIPDTHISTRPVPGGDQLVEWAPEVPRTVFAESGITEVSNLTARADPRLVLMRRTDADLLVVGPVGSGVLKRRFHLGSTTDWLLQQPPCPLAIVRSAAPARRVVVGVDGSDPAQRALEALVAMPWSRDVDVLAVGVYDGWTDPAGGLESAAKTLADAGIEHRTEQIRGRPTETILQKASAHRADLVVVGARGAGTAHRVVVGSTTSAVARMVSCNVLVRA